MKNWFVDEDGAKPGRICLAIGALGLVLILFGIVTVWGTGWGKDLFIPGATLITVALTAWVASRAIVNWIVQRDRDRQAAEYKHREEVYEQVLTFMLNRITGGSYDQDLDKQLRSKAALWGSSTTIDALGEWQVKLMSVLNAHKNEPEFAMSTAESTMLRQQYGRTLVAMRNDLSSTDKNRVTHTEVLKSIFND